VFGIVVGALLISAFVMSIVALCRTSLVVGPKPTVSTNPLATGINNASLSTNSTDKAGLVMGTTNAAAGDLTLTFGGTYSAVQITAGYIPHHYQ
jgi:hypothetical protein